MGNHALGAAALLLVALGSGCGLNMEMHYQKMRANLVAGDYENTDRYLDEVKEQFYGKDNRLLFYMDKGMILHLAGRYEESNKLLEQAKATAQELWTESVSANAAAWLTTDNSIPYQGEDFEKVLIHFVAALNFIGVGDYEAARVEARQVTSKLELYDAKYAEQEGKNAYKDDGFARWLSGKLFETEGAAGYNDAWIDYKKALAVYARDYGPRYGTPTPRFLVEDALRVLAALGRDFAGELAGLKARFPESVVRSPAETKDQGEIVLLHLSGEAPYKVDRFWEAVVGTDPIRIAYPEFVAKPSRAAAIRVKAGGQSAASELGENITAIAIQNLDDHMGRIKAKAIARAVAKYAASKAAQAAGEAMDNNNAGAALQVAGALFQVASVIAEEADKRSWITLPAEVHVARMFVPAGEVTLELEVVDRGGGVIRRDTKAVKTVPGRPTFVSFRSFD